MNLFPDRVRAVTLDGVIEPIEWATGRGNEADRLPFSTRLKSDDGAYETLQQFLALCGQAGPARCAFAAGAAEGSQALDHKFGTLMQRLLQAPVVVPTPVGPLSITYTIAVALTLGALYSPSVWPQLGAALQELWLASRGGAVDALRQTLAAAAAGTAVQPYPNGRDAGASIFCSDTDNPHDPFAWPQAAAKADHRAPLFGAAWTFVSMPCANWAARDPGRYTGPWDRPTSNPVLLVGNFFDPATRYESAVALSHELASARLLILDGWGHTGYAKSACIEQTVDRYLIAGQLPAPRTVCQARPAAVRAEYLAEGPGRPDPCSHRRAADLSHASSYMTREVGSQRGTQGPPISTPIRRRHGHRRAEWVSATSQCLRRWPEPLPSRQPP